MSSMHVPGGMHISTAANKAVALAKTSGEPVSFVFNGVDLVAWPHSTAREVELRFYAAEARSAK